MVALSCSAGESASVCICVWFRGDAETIAVMEWHARFGAVLAEDRISLMEPNFEAFFGLRAKGRLRCIHRQTKAITHRRIAMTTVPMMIPTDCMDNMAGLVVVSLSPLL